MHVPRNLQGPKTEFVVIGGQQKYLVDLTCHEAVYELKKQLGLYKSFKKEMLIHFFQIISKFIHKEQIQTKASLIYLGGNTKFFDMAGKKVQTVFGKDSSVKQNIAWIKKLKNHIPSPEILAYNLKAKTMTTRYLDFQLLQPKMFLKYHEELVNINRIIRGRRKRKVSIKNYEKLLIAPHRNLLRTLMKDSGLNEQKINLVVAHGDFHPGNLPMYNGELYILDFDSVGWRPPIFDFAYFSFVPSHFNISYAKTGEKLFRKFLNKVNATPIELLVSFSMIRVLDKKLHDFLKKRNYFIDAV